MEYLTWQEEEANLAQLRANRQAHGEDRRHGPPREGPALLQGLVIGGCCGNRMTVRSHELKRGRRLYPESLCQKEHIEEGDDKRGPHVLGAGLDAAVASLLLAGLTPLAIETSMQVHEELHAQVQEAQHLRAQQVERARSAAELAQRRFFRVDPENRLVADVLEADWNTRLRELAQVQEEAERQQEAKQRTLSALEQQAIADLVEDFPRVWKDPRTSSRSKRLVRLLLEEVTVLEITLRSLPKEARVYFCSHFSYLINTSSASVGTHQWQNITHGKKQETAWQARLSPHISATHDSQYL